jgi:hypothetical protein
VFGVLETEMIGSIGSVSPVSSLGNVSPVATGLDVGNFAQFLNAGSLSNVLTPDITQTAGASLSVGNLAGKMVGDYAVGVRNMIEANTLFNYTSAIESMNASINSDMRKKAKELFA